MVGHWPFMAQYWAQIGTPLRPSQEDLAGYLRFVREWVCRHGAPRVLLLGVTPEIYGLPWPEGHDFVAVDRTRAMIDHVWPGREDQLVECGWLDLTLPSGSRDLVLCDGGLQLLDYPFQQRRLVERLHDVLAPGGLCVIRLFTPPATDESPAAVLGDLFAGGIENLNLLKLRLGMALQESAGTGVELRTVWRTLRDVAADWERLAVRLGWPLEHLRAIDAYRDSEARYHFVSTDQAVELFCGGGRFICRGQRAPRYALGERCPIVAFERG